MDIDFNHVLVSHAEHKPRFVLLIEGKGKVDTASDSHREDGCELGKWLSGYGKTKYGLLNSYHACSKRHASFHEEMKKIATLINAGRYDEATKKLGASTDYAITFTAFINAVKQFRQEIKQ